MADVNQNAPEFTAVPPEGMSFTASPEMLAAANPFGQQDCVSVDVGREVNLSQLADEIEAKTGVQVQLTLSNPEPGKHALDRSLPDRLHVLPPVPEDVLREAVAAHEIDPDYGFTDDQRERIALVNKLRGGEKLTQEEMTRAMLLMLTESK